MKRAAMVAFVAAILGGAVYSIFRAPWYVVDSRFGGDDVRTFFEHDVEATWIHLIALLVLFYFFARLLFAGLLVIVGSPKNRTVAWYTPRGAHIQGAFALFAAIAMYANPPADYSFFELDVTRSWGGLLLIACAALSHVAIHVFKRVRVLAYTQSWVDDDGRPVPKPRHRWLRVKPQERPMMKSPLTGGANVGGDPFRVSAPVGLDAKIVKPKPVKNVEAPIAEDKDAPPPKLLV